ncbi:MAG: hypothetical protein QW203_07605 [Thermoplasmatales archaeon]
MTIQEFYYGTSWHWPVEIVPRVMLSYNYIRVLKHPWVIEKPWMLDSGAFSVISKYGKYPWDIKEYAKAIEKWHPTVAWTMDYPCEPSVREKGGYTCRESQILTNENTVKLIEAGVQVSNVVQGWTVEDYLSNLDMIKEAGLLTERLGIGTLCRRNMTNEIVKIIRAIHNSVPRWVKLHGFGVKTSILKTEARFLLYSADSAAWTYNTKRYSLLKYGRKINGKQITPYLLDFVSKMESYLGQDEPFERFLTSDIK